MTVKFDTNKLHLSDEQIMDLLVYYAKNGSCVRFKELYNKFISEAGKNEWSWCYFFIQHASKSMNQETVSY